MPDYLQRLEAAADRQGTILCLGLDPDPERLPDRTAATMESWLNDLLQALEQDGSWPAALKPNLAWYEQYGSPGLAALERLLDRWRGRVPIILDAKRGDIGTTGRAYARALFDTWGGDAATVSPWMGRDSVEPFLERCPDRGVYLLLRTSNPGARDLQTPRLQTLMQQWRVRGLGAVVGATRPEEITEPAKEFPLLVPGVGSQGGTPEAVMAALRAAGGDLRHHRVNVSSAILYAEDPVGACRRFREALAL